MTNCVLHSTGSVDRTPRRTHIFSVLSVFIVFRTCSQLFALVNTFSHVHAFGSRHDSHKTGACCLCALAPKSLICTPPSTDLFWTSLISHHSAQRLRQQPLLQHATGIRTTPCTTALEEMQCGYLANSSLPTGSLGEEEFEGDQPKPRKVHYKTEWKHVHDAVNWIHLAKTQKN